MSVLLKPNGAVTKPQVKALSLAQAQSLATLEPLLRELGLSLYCMRCHGLGMPDGVQGNNDPKGDKVEINCGCSHRILLLRAS